MRQKMSYFIFVDKFFKHINFAFLNKHKDMRISNKDIVKEVPAIQ